LRFQAAIAERAGKPHISPAMARLRRRIARLRKFQLHMARALPWPHQTVATLPDETIVCRCERITADAIRCVLRQPAAPLDINRIKALTRCGMGRCQGRYCAATLTGLIAAAHGCAIETAGRLRAQAPIRPVAIGSAGSPDESSC